MKKILDAVSRQQSKINQEQIEKQKQESHELDIKGEEDEEEEEEEDNDIFSSFVPKTTKKEKAPITQGATKILSNLKIS